MRQTVTCGNCGAEVEIADFCSNCGHPLRSGGASQAAPTAAAAETRTPNDSARSAAFRSLGRLGVPDRPSYSWIVDAAIVLILLSLLAGREGTAILIGVFVVPLLALRFLTELDLFEREPRLGIVCSIAAGFLGGLFVGVVNQFFVNEFWIENSPLKIGAAGYGGRFADAEGGPPALVMLVTGFVMPVVAIGLQMLVPVFLRKYPAYRNEVMDGVTLAAAAGFGFAAATAIVYYWPLITDGTNPRIPLEDWTATLIGVAVIRPLLFGTFAALVGAGMWHYAMVQRSSELTLPVALGVGGIMLFSVGDLLVQPAGARWELLWGAIVLFALLFVSFRLVLRKALRFDLNALGGSGHRIACPHCGRVTPSGTFCANCGRPLTALPAPSPEARMTEPEDHASADEGKPETKEPQATS
ncbi:MAG: PrsW family glutamic-type intramembrane protease [Thermomicrobiales bacterium]